MSGKGKAVKKDAPSQPPTLGDKLRGISILVHQESRRRTLWAEKSVLAFC